MENKVSKVKKLTFKDIKNYFGDRDIVLKRHYIKKYGNDDKYIYWIPNNNYDTYFSTDLHRNDIETVLWVSINDMYAEIQDEVLLKDSPYAF